MTPEETQQFQPLTYSNSAFDILTCLLADTKTTLFYECVTVGPAPSHSSARFASLGVRFASLDMSAYCCVLAGIFDSRESKGGRCRRHHHCCLLAATKHQQQLGSAIGLYIRQICHGNRRIQPTSTLLPSTSSVSICISPVVL